MLNRSRAVALLARYVSTATAQGVVANAARELGIDVDAASAADAPRLAEALVGGIRPFLSEDKLRELRVEIDAAAVTRSPRARIYAIRTEEDVSRARLGARDMCRSAGANALVCQLAATAVSEVARNILMYARGGTVEISAVDEPRSAVLVRALDQGPGIRDVEAVLSGSYKSKTGQGRGLSGVKRIANRFDLKTGPWGTSVEFELWL